MKTLLKQSITICTSAFMFLNASHGAVVAIIDSGTDMKHKQIAKYAWINPKERSDNGIDDDKNSYIDDIFGWNFAENNNKVIDYKYLGTFSQRPYKFFEIQYKMIIGEATPQEVAWVKEQFKDPAFMKELQKFGNFVHGTHVAGISLDSTNDNKIMAVKLIPTEVKMPGERHLFTMGFMKKFNTFLANAKNKKNELGKMLLKAFLTKMAKQQGEMLGTIGSYVHSTNAEIANGSFGVSSRQMEGMIEQLYKAILKKAPSEEDKKELTVHFMKEIIKNSRKLVDNSADTLFVFAAGNDGRDNDVYPTSPAGITADNSIAVAATWDDLRLATFSNYGDKSVHVAAPGVGVYSAIPGDEFIRMSGTSQAAPAVTFVASAVKNANPRLTPKDIKEILVSTVDKKDFLKGKILSEGMVNGERAVEAAKLSRTTSLKDAIARSKQTIADVVYDGKSFDMAHPEALDFVTPLPSSMNFDSI